jgi:hypothetical protein
MSYENYTREGLITELKQFKQELADLKRKGVAYFEMMCSDEPTQEDIDITTTQLMDACGFKE